MTAQLQPHQSLGAGPSRKDFLSAPAALVSDGAGAPRSMKRAASMRERSSTARERERERGDSWSSGVGRTGSQPRSRTISSMPTIGESRLANHMQTAQEGSERGSRVATPVAVDKESSMYVYMALKSEDDFSLMVHFKRLNYVSRNASWCIIFSLI